MTTSFPHSKRSVTKSMNTKKLSNEHECQLAKKLQHNFELTYQRRLSLRGSTWNFILWKVSFFNKVNPFSRYLWWLLVSKVCLAQICHSLKCLHCCCYWHCWTEPRFSKSYRYIYLIFLSSVKKQRFDFPEMSAEDL